MGLMTAAVRTAMQRITAWRHRSPRLRVQSHEGLLVSAMEGQHRQDKWPDPAAGYSLRRDRLRRQGLRLLPLVWIDPIR